MKIVVYNKKSGNEWESAVKEALPGADVQQWMPGQKSHWQADYGVIWQPPIEFFEQQTQLKAVFNQGVGVDHLVNMEGLPDNLPIFKLRGVGMEELMSDYVSYGVMHYYRDFDVYRNQQKNSYWKTCGMARKSDWTVGVLGLGIIGSAVAAHLSKLGFPVCGWSRSEKVLDGVRTFTTDDGLNEMLKQCRVLVSLLPATPGTNKLINSARLAQLPRGAVLISGGRGSVIDLGAVQASLDSQHLRGAMLDVFENEPLDSRHPIWHCPNVIITPHISAPTPLNNAMEQIAAQIEQIENGEMPAPVDRSLGY